MGPSGPTALNIQSRKAAGTSQTHSLQSFTTKVTKFYTVQYHSTPPRRQERGALKKRGGVQGKQARSILHIVDCRADNFGILRLLYVLTLYFFRKLGRKTEQFTLCRFRTTFFFIFIVVVSDDLLHQNQGFFQHETYCSHIPAQYSCDDDILLRKE